MLAVWCGLLLQQRVPDCALEEERRRPQEPVRAKDQANFDSEWWCESPFERIFGARARRSVRALALSVCLCLRTFWVIVLLHCQQHCSIGQCPYSERGLYGAVRIRQCMC